MKISILHATYFRPGGPNPVRDMWLNAADAPTDIEYLVAMNFEDLAAISSTGDSPRAIGPPVSAVTAVRNWNALAALASGCLLIVVSDDLVPPQSWDTVLRKATAGADPIIVPYAIKCTDSESPNDTLLRHPIISRAFYEKYGLFDPCFTGVYCDTDLTRRAFWKAQIIDGRHLALKHLRRKDTASYSKLNTRREYLEGQRHFFRKWGVLRRRTRVYLVPANQRDRGAFAGLRHRPFLLRSRAMIVLIPDLVRAGVKRSQSRPGIRNRAEPHDAGIGGT
jgi:hypothetical protein